jgi:type IV pilus assembly protein PilV
MFINSSPRRRHRSRAQQHRPKLQGFTLLEIMVALLVSSIGLLGLAGMQATAIANTQVSRMRSIVALQASSLAAAMHGNRAFWTYGSPLNGFATAGTTITDYTNTLQMNPSSCIFSSVPSGTGCTPVQLASFDVQTWAASMSRLLPGYSSIVACTTTSKPFSCNLTIVWSEHYVATGLADETDSADTGGLRSYSLYIEP